MYYFLKNKDFNLEVYDFSIDGAQDLQRKNKKFSTILLTTLIIKKSTQNLMNPN